MHRHRTFHLLLAACALGACAPEPGLIADGVGEGPSLRLGGEVDGSRARLSVQGRELGSVFGLSFHLRIDDELVAVVAPTQHAVLGEGAILIERVEGDDLAFGGTRPSKDAGEVELSDGELAVVELRALVGATSRVEIADAVTRRLDGSFVPLTAAGGTLTLEAP